MAAQEEKESSTSREEPSLEPAVQGAHQAAQDADIEVGPRQEESSTLTSLPSSAGNMDEGLSVVDVPAQASVGGAVKVEPPTEDRVSDTPQPVIDVESLDETITIKEEGPLSTVQEEAAHIKEKAAPPAPATPSSTPVSAIQDMNEAQAKAYVAGQVQRWEREARERMLPPRARYTWPSTGRDFEPWWTAMIATSRHLEGRTTSAALIEAWNSDLQLVRSDLPTAQDVTPIVIPPSMLSPRDRMALIQTLLVKAGFSFRNMIPEWFRSRSSQIATSAVRIAVEGVQHLLATELIEWRQVAFGVTFQVVDIQDGLLVIQVYHAEDADGDLPMTDHGSSVRLATQDVRITRAEKSARIPKHSLPSYHSSDTNNQSAVTLSETMSSIHNVSSRAGSDFVPSLFGTSGGSIESTRSGTSGSKSSQDESSSLSVWSLGQPAAGHMPFRAYAPMVMTAQGGAVQANTQMDMQVVQTILPPPPVMTELDDIVMSESGETQEALARIKSELAQKRQVDEAILAAHAEAAIQAERFRAAKENEDRLRAQQFQTEADFAERLRIQRMQDESERARWVDDVQKSTNMQIAILQQQMREMEAERVREREAAKSIQKFQASQLRDLRATSAQVQHATVTPVPDAVSQIKTESGIANFQRDAKGQDANNVRRGGYPSDSDPSSEDDDSDSSADDSDSSFCEPLSDMVVPKASQSGTTTMTIGPFETASSLDDFDEKASLSERTRWFSKEFKVKYCKSKMSDSEKYYTMKQRKAETPLDFLYRLNAAADRADIRYKNQRFKSMDDLEYALKQQEDDWDDDRQSGSSTKTRDFRADNLRQGRLRTKYPGRAYVTQSGDESDSDERYVMFEDETLEISPAQESVESHKAPPENQGLGMTMEELTQHVLKVMENSGWNKPEHMAHQGQARQSNGHPGSPSPRPSLWKLSSQHPTQLCKTLPCKKYGKFHDGRCEDWEMLESIARLARQGIVKGLPTPMLDRLLAVKADPGDGSLNH
ncbi:hypothetical protein PHMEG_00026483 [Phytophthora megakarya]|uniref:Eukaryotic/viral aspartic protease n=1 Tax=Phytophthora megakarya TaxID=4795 RepID=A0A225VC20_9STRA|nr:hypothetical protein PHMEG_00026483 [Phytophthora megakarya]